MIDSNILKSFEWLKKLKQSDSNKSYQILIVDDQLEIRNLLAITLDSHLYEMHHANDWISAIGMARAIKPAVILLDIMMPGEFDGLEVCRLIKCDTDLSSIIVLVVSALAEVDVRYKALEFGADDYLIKPFSPLALIEKVSLLLSKKEQQHS